MELEQRKNAQNEKANGTEKIGMEKKCMLHSASADSHLASQIAAERNAIVASVRRAQEFLK